MEKILVIGVGNDYRGDDAVGLVVVRQLKEIAQDGCITIMESNGDGSTLIESWKNMDRVIIIDAVKSQGRPGAVYRFDVHTQHAPKQLLCSTHAFGVAEAIELGRAMNKSPSQMIVYGIEGGNFNAGERLSPEVAKAIPDILDSVIMEIESNLSNV